MITIPATEQPEQVIFSVELFDDDINEAEQVFVLVMELLDALTPVDVDLTPRNACLVVIIDDDSKQPVAIVLCHSSILLLW